MRKIEISAYCRQQARRQFNNNVLRRDDCNSSTEVRITRKRQLYYYVEAAYYASLFFSFFFSLLSLHIYLPTATMLHACKFGANFYCRAALTHRKQCAADKKVKFYLKTSSSSSSWSSFFSCKSGKILESTVGCVLLSAPPEFDLCN